MKPKGAKRSNLRLKLVERRAVEFALVSLARDTKEIENSPPHAMPAGAKNWVRESLLECAAALRGLLDRTK